VRVLFGWLLLFGLVAAMAWITAEKRMRARERSAQVTAERAPDAPGVPARVLIGVPSGAEPLGASRTAVGRAERRFVAATPTPEQRPSLPAPKIFKLQVRPGGALSTMCQEFYKQEERPPLAAIVEAVARWNQLSSPDSLQVGQSLELPPLELLFPE
jgi:nucleoid-associated protein YgaU